MPSLNDLGQFKFSFNQIGMEKDAYGQTRELPYEDLPLPTTEPPPMSIPARGAEGGEADFDMNAFMDTLPTAGDIPDAPPPLDDIPLAPDLSAMDDLLGLSTLTGGAGSDEPTVAEEPAGFDLPADEPSMDDLLGGHDYLSPSSQTGMDLSGTEEPSADEPSMDDLLGGHDYLSPSSQTGMDLSTTEETAAFEPPADEPMPEEVHEHIDLGGETIDAQLSEKIEEPAEETAEEAPSMDFGDLGSMDLGGESDTPSMDLGGFDESPLDIGGEAPSMDIGDLGSMDIGGEEAPSMDIGDLSSGFEEETPLDMGSEEVPSMDFGGEEAPLDLGGEGEVPSVDLGDLGADFETGQIDLGSEQEAFSDMPDFGSGDFGGETGSSDFALDGLDEIFEKTKIGVPVTPAPRESFFSKFRKKRKEQESDLPDAESDIEEIQLSESDVEKLLATIASYPLNLRIACEELIAEQVILPQQLSRLIHHLVNGAHARQTANLVEEITGKPVIIPKSYEKMTGAAFEAEQASFAYIFFHNFLPVFRLVAIIAAFIGCVAYLGYKFIYIPVKAENLYKRGYERIPEGEYQRANQLFEEAFKLHSKKKWFYLYAERFRDQRRYMLAEEKYDQLLGFKPIRDKNGDIIKIYPRDKKGVLDYAYLNTYYLLNYEKANTLLQRQLLDWAPNDYDGLVAAGDNFLLWADSDPERFYDKYDDARFHYARLLELKGWQVPIVERMLKFFIRTDNLKEVLHLRNWFESDKKRNLLPSSKAELAGYLLDKQMEEIKGVPDPYLEGITNVRALLLEAIAESSPQIAGKKNVKEENIPEPHYHLARYHKLLNNTHEEKLALENAIRAFDYMKMETVLRRQYRVDTLYRYSNLLIGAREFFPAEAQLVRGIELYEDFLGRNLLRPNQTLPKSNIPQLGQLYAAKGDIEFYAKSGNMEAALVDYGKAESYGYAPPEVQYRMGVAYYQLENWRSSLEYLFNASKELPLNRRVLYALGNAAYQRGDYFAAQGYYDRLLDILENQRVRLPVLLPNDNPQFLELGERLMMARNNMGVVYEYLADQTGNREYRSKALSLYSESARAWDSITRNPETMTRMSLIDTPGAPSINQGYLNAHNAMRPGTGYTPQIFPRIDRDALEPSRWEELVGAGALR